MQTRFLLPAALAALAVAGLGQAAHAQQRLINFDNVLTGTNIANTYSGFGVQLVGSEPQGAVFTTDTVANSLPNSIDATAGPITINLTSLYGTGATAFSIDMLRDPQGFGSSNTAITFFNALGTQVGSISNINQNAAASQTFTFSAAAFRTVVLPGDAYYDNLRLTPAVGAPEPGTLALLAFGGVLPLVGAAVRRRATTAR